MLCSNISSSSTCPHNMVNFGGPLAAEIGPVVWGTPANFNGFASWLRYCSGVAQRKSTKLCTMFGRLLAWYTIYTFWISCLLTEFCHVQNSLSVHLRTIEHVSRAISSQLRHLSTFEKKLRPTKQQYVLQMSPQYGELRPTSG